MEIFIALCVWTRSSPEKNFFITSWNIEDPRPYQPVEPHFEWEDERMNSVLRENTGLIFTPHRSTPLSADFNFPVNLLLKQDGWISEIYQTLDLVANINNDESFKINLSMGFLLQNRDTAEHRFFVPHANNAFFKKPIHIERPSSWRRLYSQLDEESLKAYVTHHRESTKWVPLMITNIMIHTFYLGTPMGNGKLPQYIKDHRSIVGLDTDLHGTPYEDKLWCAEMLGFPSEPQGHWEWIWTDGNQNTETQTTVGTPWIGLVARTAVWRYVQYFSRYLLSLWRRSCGTPLSQWRNASRQDGPQLTWHPPELREECSRLPAKISMQQLRAKLQTAHWLEAPSGQLCQWYGIWISRRIPQNDSLDFRSIGRIRHHNTHQGTFVSLVHHLWFWSHTFPRYWRATHTMSQMDEKTWTYLSQCRFQRDRIRRSQMFHKLRSQRIDCGHDDLHGLHCWLSLYQCRSQMGVCHSRCGATTHLLQDQVGGQCGRWGLWYWCL